MKLYLVQHAEAKKEEEDRARPFSEKGWKDMDKVSGILHGRKLRAKQTVEKLGEVVRPTEDINETDGLAPLDDPTIWGRVIGYMPWAEDYLASFLALSLEYYSHSRCASPSR